MKTKNYYKGLKEVVRFDNKLKCKKGKPCKNVCIPKKYKCKEGENKDKVKPKLELTKLAIAEKNIKRTPKEKKSVNNLLELGLNSLSTVGTTWYVGSVIATMELSRQGNEIENKYKNNLKGFFNKIGKDETSQEFTSAELKELSDIQGNFVKDLEKYEEDFFGKFGWTIGAVTDGANIKKQLKEGRKPFEEMRDGNKKTAQDLEDKQQAAKVEVISSQLGNKQWHEWFEIDPTNLPQDPNERKKVLKKQWLKLSKQYHPDLASNPNDEKERNETMQQINFIWSKLEENDGKFLY